MKGAWLCRLPPGPLGDLQRLNEQGLASGIAAWCVSVAVGEGGVLQPEQPLQALLDWPEPAPRLCLELQLRQPLSPAAEARLAEALLRWLAHPRLQQLQGHPLLLLGDQEGWSQPVFGRQRLELSLRRLLHGQVVAAPVLLDVQRLPEQDLAPEAYLRYLRAAHYGPWPTATFVPLVLQPPVAGLERSQEHYAAWLTQAGAVSCLLHAGAPDAPVLIDRWPGHQRNWQAPLQVPSHSAIAEALEPQVQERAWGHAQPEHLALLVHGFYLERLQALLARLPVGGGCQGLPPIDLYVSSPIEQLAEAERLLSGQGWPRVRLFGVPNRGRDWAPLVLQLLPAALAVGHRFFVKAHTKASPHLGPSGQWGEAVLDALLDPERLSDGLNQLQSDPALALLAAPGTMLPLSLTLDQNLEALLSWQRQQALDGLWLLQQRFIAGSMMLGRLDALRSLQRLGLGLGDFEPEAAQTDGTLAHGLERWLCVMALQEGWRLDNAPGPSVQLPAFAYGWV